MSTQHQVVGTPGNKRLVSVYDLCSQPVSFGDFYMFQFGACTLAKMIGVDVIDFYVMFDTNVRHLDGNFHPMLEPDKYHNRALRLLPILEVCPLLGSVSVVNSRTKLDAILSSYVEPIEMWPTRVQIDSRAYTYYQIISMVNLYKQDFGEIPAVTLKSPQRNWIENLHKNILNGRLFVTVNIRRNEAYHHQRNSSLSDWGQFFDYCSARYPVTFIVLCEIHEIDPDLRSRANVLYAKDLGTTSDLDCSLVISSAFHMGSSSGPCAVAFLTQKPFFVSSMDCLHRMEGFQGAVKECQDGYIRALFNGELQRHINGPENFEILVREFETIWNSRDWSGWVPNV